MSPEFEDWLRRSLDFLSAKLSRERAVSLIGAVIRETPELYNEFIGDVRVQPFIEATDDLLH
jgi:hypothetical protein